MEMENIQALPAGLQALAEQTKPRNPRYQNTLGHPRTRASKNQGVSNYRAMRDTGMYAQHVQRQETQMPYRLCY